MKKIIISIALCCFCIVAFSQTSDRVFKPFRVDITTGFGFHPSDGGAIVSWAASLEPRYAISDRFVTGLRMEAAVVGGSKANANGVVASAGGHESFALTGDYYFNNNRFRPFVGGGIGISSVSTMVINGRSDGTIISEIEVSESKFLAMARTGFDWGKFRMSLEYNYVGKVLNANSNYISIKVGGFFGGGRYNKNIY
jgi:outer membrane protein X